MNFQSAPNRKTARKFANALSTAEPAASRTGGRRANGSRRSSAPFEALETRTMMAAQPVPVGVFPPPTHYLQNQTITVRNTAPAGDGSLLEAIKTANSSVFQNVTINFQLPANSVIRPTNINPLPAVQRNNVTIDGSAVTGLRINGGLGGGVFGVYILGSNDTFKGLEIDGFNTGFGVYGGSNNLFDLDKTSGCDTGILLDAQSHNNTIIRSIFSGNTSHGIYVGGQNNQIGELGVNAPGYPDSNAIINVSSGNGIEVANSNNFVRSNYVTGASNDAILISQGSGNSVAFNPVVASGASHGSAIEVRAGANGNSIGGANAGNTIHYSDAGAKPGSYAINVQSTGNIVKGNTTFLNGSGDPSYSGHDIFIAAGNDSDIYG